MEPKLNISYSVTAYDESYGGYGIDSSKSGFLTEQEAINYARGLDKSIFHGEKSPVIYKNITMNPIHIKIEF